MSNMDYIDIQVSTSASRANAELDNLIVKLGAVQSSLSSVGGKSVNFGTQIKSQSNSATAGLNKVSASMNKTAHSTNVLSKAFGTFYANYFWVVRGIKGLWNSIENTADYMESYQYLNVAFNKIAKDWSGDFKKYGGESAEAYAKSFTYRMNEVFSKLSGIEFDNENMRLASNNVKNLGLNIKEITQYAAQLGSVTNSVGLSGESSMAASTMFTQLAGDLSSLYNVDYSSVAKNLQSGLIGQSRALYKYGIDITNATLQTKAYELGLEKAVSEMTQAEKMQLRMLVIIDQSRVAWGNLANEIDQPSNQIRLFKNNLSELSQMLGQLFIPLLSKVMPVVNGITIAIKNLLGSIAGILGIKLDFNSLKPNEIEEGYDGVSDSLDNVADSAKNAKSHLLGIDELNVVEPQTESGGASGAVSGGIDLTDEILKATEEYQKIWDEAYAQMENRAQAVADSLAGIFKPVEKLFKDIKIGDWFAVGQDVSSIASGILDLFSNSIAKVDWEILGKNIGLFLEGIDWGMVIESALDLSFNIFDVINEVWSESMNIAPLETSIISALALMKFTGLGELLVDAIKDELLKGITNAVGEEFVDEASGEITKKLTAIGALKITIPIVASIAVLWWEYSVGSEQEELKNNVAEKGEEEGRKASGTGVLDKQALHRYDMETTNEKIYSSWNETLTKIGKEIGLAFGAWDENIIKYQQDTVAANENIAISYGTLFSNWGNRIETHKKNTQTANDSITTSYVMMFDDWMSKIETHKKNEKVANDTIYGSYNDTFTNIGEILGDWWEDDVKPLFNLETWKEFGENIKKGISEKWTALQTWFENTALYKFFQNVGQNFQNASLNQLFPSFSTLTPQAYATGGFPEDGLFFANHTELVGKFTNGRTAVANNTQIVEGIKYGVREAVSETLAPYLADIAESNREVANKDLSVNIGDREIARANRRGQKSLGYQLITE